MRRYLSGLQLFHNARSLQPSRGRRFTGGGLMRASHRRYGPARSAAAVMGVVQSPAISCAPRRLKILPFTAGHDANKLAASERGPGWRPRCIPTSCPCLRSASKTGALLRDAIDDGQSLTTLPEETRSCLGTPSAGTTRRTTTTRLQWKKNCDERGEKRQSSDEVVRRGRRHMSRVRQSHWRSYRAIAGLGIQARST
jgi:hypothetical protein